LVSGLGENTFLDSKRNTLQSYNTNYFHKILYVIFVGVLSTLILALVHGEPAYGCTPPTCHFVVDASSTGYVFGYGAKINVTGDGPTTHPFINVTELDSSWHTISHINFTTSNYTYIDNVSNNVTVAYPVGNGKWFQEYVNFTSNPLTNNVSPSQLADPPNLFSRQPTQTSPINLKFDYCDGKIFAACPNISLILPLVAPGSVPQLKTDHQPDLTVLQCPNSPTRGGHSSDFICDRWKTQYHDAQNNPLGLDINITDSSGTRVDYIWKCTNTDPNGPFNPDPSKRLDYPCPSVNHRDVYVEVDWMQNHIPSIQALKDVIKAYNNPNYNPYNVYLHIELGTEVPFVTNIDGPNNGGDLTDFTKIKTNYFGADVGAVHNDPTNNGIQGYSSLCPQGTVNCISDLLTAKRQVFHYVLFGNSQTGAAYQYSSGMSEVSSLAPYGATNDALISLGKFSYGEGSIDQQEGAFMHEMGHMLGLSHGGAYKMAGANVYNCKPNYLSVMSYTRQFSDLFTNPGGRALDYSSEFGHTIDESKSVLSNEIAITSTNQYTVYGLSTGLPSLPTLGISPDFDNDAANEGQSGDTDLEITGKRLHTEGWTNLANGESPYPVGCPSDSYNEALIQYRDWLNLMFDMTTTDSWSD
jgi:hypothetical protein